MPRPSVAEADLMVTISAENKVTGEQQESDAATRSGDDDKEKGLDRGSVRGYRERPTAAGEQGVVESDDAQSFLRYDERRW
jgi:hypothetical protein